MKLRSLNLQEKMKSTNLDTNAFQKSSKIINRQRHFDKET